MYSVCSGSLENADWFNIEAKLKLSWTTHTRCLYWEGKKRLERTVCAQELNQMARALRSQNECQVKENKGELL